MQQLTIKQILANHFKVTSFQPTMQSILENGLFLPQYGLNEQQLLLHKTVFTNISFGDNSNLGTIIGMTVLGLIGFLMLGFTILGGIGGGVIGIVLGRVVGKKIMKKNKAAEIEMKQFDILAVRVSSLLKWGQMNLHTQSKESLIQSSFIVQRLLTEFKPILHYKYFNYKFQKKAYDLLKQIQLLFAEQQCLVIICLHYKLIKEYQKILKEQIIYSKFNDQQISIITKFTINNVLIPFLTIFEKTHHQQHSPLISKLCYKINKLLLNQQIQRICTKDEEMDLEYIKMLSHRLSEKITINNLEQYLQQQKIGYLYKQTQDTSVEIKPETTFRPKSAIDVFSYDAVNDEITAQKPCCMSLNLHRAHSVYQKNVEEQIVDDDFSSKFHQPSIQLQPPSIIKSLAKSSIFSSQGQQNLSTELQEKFEQLVNLIYESPLNWDVIHKSEGQAIYKTLKNDSASIYVKGYSFLQGIDQNIVYEAIHNAEKRVKWDKMLLHFHVIETESESVDVIYYYVESPMGVSNREFCQKRIVRFNYPNHGDICLLYFSVEHDKVPKYKGHVRAQTNISGYIIESTDDGTRLHLCSHTDVKGKIPKSLVNFVAARAPITWISSLRKGCINLQMKN